MQCTFPDIQIYQAMLESNQIVIGYLAKMKRLTFEQIMI